MSYDLPSFNCAFRWTETEAEAAHLLNSQLASIAGLGFDPAAALAAAVAQAAAILRAGDDPDNMRGAHVLLTA